MNNRKLFCKLQGNIFFVRYMSITKDRYGRIRTNLHFRNGSADTYFNTRNFRSVVFINVPCVSLDKTPFHSAYEGALTFVSEPKLGHSA